MREILFRGKQKAGDYWICGDLRQWSETRKGILDYSFGGTREVYPETIGQFTGLNDKNGKKIFEGDIVKAERICNGNSWTGCVAWWKGCFAIQGLKDGNNVPAIDLFKDYEVIGNIHDNPELLEGKK